MSQLTAYSVLPLFAALDTEQQQAFMREAEKMTRPAAKKEKKRSASQQEILDKLGPEFLQENTEQLIYKITQS